MQLIIAILLLSSMMFAEDVPKQTQVPITVEQQNTLLKIELKVITLQTQLKQLETEYMAKEAEICKGQKLGKSGDTWICVPAAPQAAGQNGQPPVSPKP